MVSSIKAMKLLRLLIIAVLALALSPPLAHAQAQGPCGRSYVVQQGDTLSEIAELCRTTVADILAVNPGLTSSSRIFVGQRLAIPEPEQILPLPIVGLSPICGLPGDNVTVQASGLPPNSIVEVGLGERGAAYDIDRTLRASDTGELLFVIEIPESAEASELWVVTLIAQTGGPSLGAISNSFTVIPEPPQAIGAFTYTVQSGDTLRIIAQRFGLNIFALVEANPQITNPSLISVGQVLNIPGQTEGQPTATITPICGPPGSEVNLFAEDFPEITDVELGVGQWRADFDVIAESQTTPTGTLTTRVTIPEGAQRNERWVVVVQTGAPVVRAVSNTFYVVRPPELGETKIYIVQEEDTLNSIATAFNTTTSAIMDANPGLENPNQIVPGQRLLIPPSQANLNIFPLSGLPGAEIQIELSGFPPNAPIDLALSREEAANITLLFRFQTDPSGELVTQLSIPETAEPGERWVVIAATQSGGSGLRVVSETFRVSGPLSVEQARIDIAPEFGPPGTRVYLVGTGFPQELKVEISFGRLDANFQITDLTRSDINGTFSSSAIVPSPARAGGGWQFQVRVLPIDPEQEPLEAVSPVFIVISR